MSESQQEEKPISPPTDSVDVNEDEPMPMPGSQVETDNNEEGPVENINTDQETEGQEMDGEQMDSQETEGEQMDSQETEGEQMDGEQEQETESNGSEETKPAKAQAVLKKASNFRQKLTKTKRKFASLDDSQKEKIRSELVNEFVNVLKLYKHKTTRKKYIRRLNGLRTAFNQSLNKLNGTTRQRRRKSKKQQPVEYSQVQEESAEVEKVPPPQEEEPSMSGNPL